MDTTSGTPVNDATVVKFKKEGQIYLLAPSPGDSDYYRPAEDLQVECGHTFRMAVEHNGQIVWG